MNHLYFMFSPIINDPWTGAKRNTARWEKCQFCLWSWVCSATRLFAEGKRIQISIRQLSQFCGYGKQRSQRIPGFQEKLAVHICRVGSHWAHRKDTCPQALLQMVVIHGHCLHWYSIFNWKSIFISRVCKRQWGCSSKGGLYRGITFKGVVPSKELQV